MLNKEDQMKNKTLKLLISVINNRSMTFIANYQLQPSSLVDMMQLLIAFHGLRLG